MPSASHDQIEPRQIAPGYSSRFTDWGGITVAFEKAHAGQDASAMVRGLPDDRCQAPHWGFLTLEQTFAAIRRNSAAAESSDA
jgi:hypothetical protein